VKKNTVFLYLLELLIQVKKNYHNFPPHFAIKRTSLLKTGIYHLTKELYRWNNLFLRSHTNHK